MLQYLHLLIFLLSKLARKLVPCDSAVHIQLCAHQNLDYFQEIVIDYWIVVLLQHKQCFLLFPIHARNLMSIQHLEDKAQFIIPSYDKNY